MIRDIHAVVYATAADSMYPTGNVSANRIHRSQGANHLTDGGWAVGSGGNSRLAIVARIEPFSFPVASPSPC